MSSDVFGLHGPRYAGVFHADLLERRDGAREATGAVAYPGADRPALEALSPAALDATTQALTALGEPTALLAALAMRVRGAQTARRTSDVREAADRAECLEVLRQKAARDAARAAEKASGFLGLSKLLGKIVSGVAVAAAAATVVATGGASLPLLATGAALVYGGPAIAAAAGQSLGLSPEATLLVAAALQVTGAILMGSAGAGAAAGGGAGTATTASAVATVVADVSAYVQTGVGVVAAATRGAAAGYGYDARLSRAEGAEKGAEAEAAHEEVGAGVEDLRRVVRAFSRVAERARAIREARHGARMTAARLHV